MNKIEIEFELKRLKKQKLVAIEASTYNTNIECNKAIHDIIETTNNRISYLNSLLAELNERDKEE